MCLAHKMCSMNIAPERCCFTKAGGVESGHWRPGCLPGATPAFQHALHMSPFQWGLPWPPIWISHLPSPPGLPPSLPCLIFLHLTYHIWCDLLWVLLAWWLLSHPCEFQEDKNDCFIHWYVLVACNSGRHIICVLLIIVFLVLSILPVTY